MDVGTRSGPLAAHYRDFIARNRTRPPQLRRRILDVLKKYSLADIPGLATQFNREEEALTAEKLAAIERLVEDGE